MPVTQVSAVSNYDFGAPTAKSTVGLFLVLKGAKVTFRFENTSSVDATVTLNVSNTANGPYSVTTSGNNVTAVNGLVVQASTEQTADVLLRAGQDNYLQVQAQSATGARFQMQVRNAGERCLEPPNSLISGSATVVPIQTPTFSTL